MFRRRVSAYSLIELVVVLTILSMVSMVAVPSYQQWICRFHYWAVLQEVHPIKLQVEWCYWQHASLETCSLGSHGLSFSQDAGSLIESMEVEEGVIHVVPKARRGVTHEDELVLTPRVHKQRLLWQYSGRAVKKGYVRSG